MRLYVKTKQLQHTDAPRVWHHTHRTSSHHAPVCCGASNGLSASCSSGRHQRDFFGASFAATGSGGSAITVGAAVSINHLIDMLESASTAQTGGASSHAILVKHLSKVANNQVRNVGSCECSNGRLGV